jgi:hypothetical protein
MTTDKEETSCGWRMSSGRTERITDEAAILGRQRPVGEASMHVLQAAYLVTELMREQLGPGAAKLCLNSDVEGQASAGQKGNRPRQKGRRLRRLRHGALGDDATTDGSFRWLS